MDFAKPPPSPTRVTKNTFNSQNNYTFLDVCNTIYSDPLMLYGLLCNTFVDYKFELNADGIALFLLTTLSEPIDVKVTDSHILFTNEMKFLLSDLNSDDLNIIQTQTNSELFLCEKINPTTKRVTHATFKHNDLINVDKTYIVCWFIFYIFKYTPDRYSRVKNILIGVISILDSLPQFTNITTKPLPEPFDGCKNLFDLKNYMSNPNFYKKIVRYI